MRHLSCLFLLSAGGAFGQAIITTIAGTEYLLNPNGPALSVPIGRVENVTVDPSGQLVFSDPSSQMVLRLRSDGALERVAGNGLEGYSGDGDSALNASLNSPQGVVYDPAGNLYIADQFNHRVRRVTPDGTIETYAGDGIGRFQGDGAAARLASLNGPYALAFGDGGLYINDRFNRRIRRVRADGSIATFAEARATCSDVVGISVGPQGSVWYADNGCHVVRRIQTNGNDAIIAGQAGTPGFAGDGGLAIAALLRSPTGIAVASDGAVYFSDLNNLRIRRITPDGRIETFAGNGELGFSGDGGAARSARFKGLFGLALSASGELWIADRENYRVRRITGGIVSTVAGNGAFLSDPAGTPALQLSLLQPFGVTASASGGYYIAETGNNRVLRVDRNGRVSLVAGNGMNAFGGDGGPPASASLGGPISVAEAPNGTVYIADTDNSRIRAVTGRLLTTFAGGGRSLNADNVQATSVALNQPFGVATDRDGNVYIADTGNNRILRVTQSGASSVFAGTGNAGFSGDGGPAKEARLNLPVSIAVDRDANVYFADLNNARIRRINTSGVIATIAGGGTGQGVSGQATQARLVRPAGLAVDAAGNVYFADFGQNSMRVARVTPAGEIATIAGTGARGFAGDGLPPEGALLNNPFGVAIDVAGNLLIADRFNNRIRQVSTVQPTLEVSPSIISFSATSGGAVTSPQDFNVSSSQPGVFYAVTIDSESQSWLKTDVSLVGQYTPGRGIQVTADPSALPPGVYKGTITIASASAAPPERSIAVDFTVKDGVPPKLSVESRELTFAFTQDSASLERSLTIANTGGGTLEYSIETTAEPWLSVSPATGSATPAQAARVAVLVDPAGLEPRTYTASIFVRAAGSDTRVELPVSVTVSSSRAKMLLSQVGLTFTAAAGGGAPLPKSFAVLNAGRGDLNFTVQATTLSGGPDWVSVRSSRNFIAGGSTDVPIVEVAVNAQGLEPGSYYARVRLLSEDADNSPQTATIALNVLPPGSAIPPEVQPTSLIFIGEPGTVPGSQDVFISNAGSAEIAYTSNRSDDELRLVYGPASGAVRPGQPSRLVVQPSTDFATALPGIKRGQISIQFADGSTQSISVLSVVGTVTGQKLPGRERGADGCDLQILYTSLQPNFVVAPGQAVTVQTSIKNLCTGKALGTVGGEAAVANLSVANEIKPLAHRGNGVWECNWTPAATPGPVTLAVYASGGTVLQPARNALAATLVGTIRAPITQDPPRTRALQDGASQEERDFVAPGSVITLYGERLAARQEGPTDLPWPVEIADTAVELGGRDLPLLYVAEGVINAQVPYDLVANTRHQLLVRRGVTSSVPIEITVADAHPAIYAENQAGFGQGIIKRINEPGAPYANPASPAHKGEVVRVYCNGLGRVSPDIGPGQAAPETPQRRPLRPVVVTIGNTPATVVSVALEPGSAGRYIVDVIVPADSPEGDAVEVTITSVGLKSKPVTMAIRQ